MAAPVTRGGSLSVIAILATGGPLANALAAATALAAEGVSAEVINVATVKPLDEEGIVGSAAKTGRVVTVEDHSIHGGLGSAVAELLGERLPTPIKRVGVTTFGESGDMKGLYAKHGLDAGGIARTVLKFLNR
jgi:transketolase